MKQIVLVLILIISIIGCKSDECKCAITNDELNQIVADLTELKESIGYDWQKQLDDLQNVPIKSYYIEMDNSFLNYIKTYRVVKSVNQQYVEINLSSKYIRDKTTKYRSIKQSEVNLSEQDWNELESIMQNECFWTKQAYKEPDKLSTENLIYVVEGIDANRNPCTKNRFHRIVRHSRTDPDIAQMMSQLLQIEPMNDLDSLIALSINKR